MKIKRCYYCKCIIPFSKLKFEDNYICKSCIKFVPKWTFHIRQALDQIKEGS